MNCSNAAKQPAVKLQCVRLQQKFSIMDTLLVTAAVSVTLLSIRAAVAFVSLQSLYAIKQDTNCRRSLSCTCYCTLCISLALDASFRSVLIRPFLFKGK